MNQPSFSRPRLLVYEPTKNLCAFGSLASVFYYSEHLAAAATIKDLIPDSVRVYDRFKLVITALKNKRRIMSAKWIVGNRRRKNIKNYCLLEDDSDDIVMALLIGSVGSMSHVVCKYEHWIFDLNWPNAIECTRESLDWCVGTGVTDLLAARVTYTGVKKAVAFC